MVAKQQHATPKKRTKQDIFLEDFAIHGNISLACRAAAINRTTVYRWKETSDTFLLRYNQAFEEAKDNIRAEIYRRGHDGYYEDVMIAGKKQRLHKYSDTLLIFHAKMLMPEYREKQDINLHTSGGIVETYKVRLPENGRNEEA